MNLKIAGFSLVALCVCNTSLLVLHAAEPKEESKNSSPLASFAQLAGEWTGTGIPVRMNDGDHLVVSPRIDRFHHGTAGGSDLVDDFDVMLHVAMHSLLLTHYCMLGNQPQMRAKPKAGDNKVAFEFLKATNLASDKDMYMRSVTFTFIDKDTLKTEWTNYNEGKEAGKAVFELKRKK